MGPSIFCCICCCLTSALESGGSRVNISVSPNTLPPHATMSEERLGKLRGKLKEITEHIDEADATKTDAVHANIEAMARLEKLETELQSASRRTLMVKKDLADITARGEVSDGKLSKVTVESEEIESKEAEAEENIDNLESSLKDMRRSLEINTVRVTDAERKVKVCENDIAKNREKAEGYEARVAAQEGVIESHGKRLEELEESEGAAGEKEALNEEKVEFLTVQLKETEVRADAAERMNAVLTNTMAETEAEIASWAKKTADMEELMINMDNIAD